MKVKGVFVELAQDVHITSILRPPSNIKLEPNSVNVITLGLKKNNYYEKGDLIQIHPIENVPFEGGHGILIAEAITEVKI